MSAFDDAFDDAFDVEDAEPPVEGNADLPRPAPVRGARIASVFMPRIARVQRSK